MAAYNQVLNCGSPPDPRRRCSKFLNLNWWKGHCYHYKIFLIMVPRVGDGDPSFLVHPAVRKGRKQCVCVWDLPNLISSQLGAPLNKEYETKTRSLIWFYCCCIECKNPTTLLQPPTISLSQVTYTLDK